MSKVKEILTSEWSILSVAETDVLTTEFISNNNADENNLPDVANIIIDGIENNINSSIINVESLTIDFESNKRDDRKTNSSLLNSKQLKPTEVEKSLEAVSKYNKRFKSSTFYQSIKQYKGTVLSVDESTNTFTAYLINIDEEDDELLAEEFSFKDVPFASDRELIRVGAIFIWIIGQESQHGTLKNVTHFIFRRTPVIRGGALQEAKNNAKKWAELFNGIGTAETTTE